MRRVPYHPDARTEFLHEVDYFAAVSARLAEHHDNAVRLAEERAGDAPEAWPKYKGGTRRVIDRTFKFSLAYVHSDSEVYVVAVASMPPQPGYWQRRLGRP